MKCDLIRHVVRIAGAAALVALAALPFASRADTVASLLGNFSINQYCGMRLANDAINLHYVVVFGQLPALRELHLADTDGDGVTTQAERDAYVKQLAPTFGDQLKVTVDGVPVPLRLTHWTSSLPTEQGGFSLRLDADFSGSLPRANARVDRNLRFANQNFSGRFGWQEIAVEASPSVKVFDTDAFSTSITGGLTQAVQTMPAAGPLAERAVHLTFTEGAAPAGAQFIQPRAGSVTAASQNSTQVPDRSEGNWLQRDTRRLIGLISAPRVAPQVALLALLAAVLLGALHAFSPGHGKTVVGAYLIGSRGTPRHAVFLGITVTVTHTLGVFALGFATLFASRFIVPERLFPILSLLSGLLVLGMGMVLLAQRWQSARKALTRRPDRHYGQPTDLHASAAFRPLAPAAQFGSSRQSYVVAYAQGQHLHRHDHLHHGCGASHTHDGTLMHSHGGSFHTHLPPGSAGDKVTWRSLLALGVSGGLVPCPSAMVLLLAAVALNKTVLGLLLVVAFSVGLALTLTAVGMAFLYARNHMRTPSADARWPRLLPVLSAGAITVVGAVLCCSALMSAGI